MRTTSKIARLALGLALAGALGCSGATGGTTGPAGDSEPPGGDNAPADVSGTFKLTSHNGNSLPALVWYDNTAEGIDAEMWIENGSIVLRSDGTYRHSDASSLIIEGVSAQTWN